MALSPARIWFRTVVVLILMWILKLWFQWSSSVVSGISFIVVAVAFAVTALILDDLKNIQRDAWIAATVCLIIGLYLLGAFKHGLAVPEPQRIHVQNSDYQIVYAGFSLQDDCDSQEEDCSKDSFSVGRIAWMIILGIIIAIFFLPEKGPRGQIPPF